MEQLRAELSHLLGEKLSRVECVNEKADTALWSLYDSQGNPMPLMARSFTSPGVARQLAWKMSMLARQGTVRMPTVYGVMTHEEHSGPDVLLIERLRGVPVEAPARSPERWEQLKDQIVEALLGWHRQDSGGLVGPVDSTQENLWPLWYRQRVEVLWGTLNQFNNTGLTMQDKRILFRTRECLPALFDGFNDNCVLVHGNFTLRSMLKDPRSDQLLAMVGPGIMLWAPREYELFRLSDSGAAEGLLWHYLQRAPVAEAFLWRRWLYLLWDEVAQLVNTGRFNRANFDLATKSLLPWLA
ncbi:TPA: YcbJ family phosphotransferase [Enterobacter ludwigii]|uniref:YcbJ family phosphotransferase n=1 Tax=Enterobacter TaxID=547 RepID=UPI0015F65462|nr:MULTISPECIES: YcbJ family phosphotransferase [Enterobacter]MBA7771097.1 YcbJ family phosphotransferase [Enterobacter sp. RHBSTW-00974]MBA7775433.1 YcbJ family phosphotransferase [Enterobacter sp. RHBSTW-00318]MBA7828894.1 YcbJ family phosphotransferase [Enterobacter sp. RHBSTW-00340]MBA8036691.1 YcbJ family phosphotransferase [Enterobacter sp. RHBSTW-00131]MBG0584484.1 YcbJ family phosphotransferase [Enterobacter ludwigii]